MDADVEALAIARQRSVLWARPSDFILCDIAREPDRIPADADIVLAFNVLSYLADTAPLLEHFHKPRKRYHLVVRQYDGGTIRIGPMSSDDRFMIDSSLRASLEASAEFSYYALDRTYSALMRSQLSVETMEFELTQRHTPFPPEFLDYFNGTVAWMRGHLSDDSRYRLDRMLQGSLYFAEIDLVAVLSGGL
jgi:hypothetical protein